MIQLILMKAAFAMIHHPFFRRSFTAGLMRFKKLGTVPGPKTMAIHYSDTMENKKTLIAGLILNLGLLGLFIAYLVAALFAGIPS
jgi:hypothetical protein